MKTRSQRCSCEKWNTIQSLKYGKNEIYKQEENVGELVAVVTNGEIYKLITQTIRAARVHVDMVFFVFLDGVAARMVSDAINEACARGVRVRIIVNHSLFVQNSISHLSLGEKSRVFICYGVAFLYKHNS